MMNSISNRVHHTINKLDKTDAVYCECEWFNHNYNNCVSVSREP